MKPNHNAKVVKIDSSRGYGDKLWIVLKENNREYELSPIDRPSFKMTIYKAHCYQDRETSKEEMRMKKAEVNKILQKN